LGDFQSVPRQAGMVGRAIVAERFIEPLQDGRLARPGFGEIGIAIQGSNDGTGLGLEVRLAEAAEGDDEFGVHRGRLLVAISPNPREIPGSRPSPYAGNLILCPNN
jgi:hypothetical protein